METEREQQPASALAAGKPTREMVLAAVDRSFPRPWLGRLAYVISMIGSPPVLGVAAIAITASILARTTSDAWPWALVFVALAIATPMVYIVLQVHRGRISDIDVQLREQRAKPQIMSVVSTALACVVLLLGQAPIELTALAIALCLQALIIYGVTLRWKISMHSSAAAGAATLVWAMTGALLPLLIIVPLVVWSRVRLKRHTFMQTVAGAALGFAVFLLAARLA